MLVLSRRKNESLVINNDIVITIVEIRGDKVRLGIMAPKEASVHRQEVFDILHGADRPTPPREEPVRSPEELPFLRAIQDQPADVGLRLVFADWLEERGDPLGAYVRCQCQLAQLPPEDEGRPDLEARRAALWVEHGAAWRFALPSFLWTSPSAG